jgi:hypothetical protein
MRVVIRIVNYLKNVAKELSDERAYARHLR